MPLVDHPAVEPGHRGDRRAELLGRHRLLPDRHALEPERMHPPVRVDHDVGQSRVVEQLPEPELLELGLKGLEVHGVHLVTHGVSPPRSTRVRPRSSGSRKYGRRWTLNGGEPAL